MHDECECGFPMTFDVTPCETARGEYVVELAPGEAGASLQSVRDELTLRAATTPHLLDVIGEHDAPQ